MLHSWINEWEASESALVHGIDQAFLAVWETGFLTQKLPVEVTAVIWSFLQLDKTRQKWANTERQAQKRREMDLRGKTYHFWFKGGINFFPF